MLTGKYKRNSLDKMIDDIIEDEENLAELLTKNFDEYINEGVIKTDLYQFWKSKKQRCIY